MASDIRRRLQQMADPEYLAFTRKISPDAGEMLGVRTPQLRVLAKELAREDWRAVLPTLGDTFEERMLQGMIVALAKMDLSERYDRVAAFVPRIDCWAVCDSFCSSLSVFRKDPARSWAFVLPYLSSAEEYTVRFGVVMLMDHFIDNAHIGDVLALLSRVNHPGYYVKMAVAWAVSVCYVKFPEITHAFLRTACPLDDFTYNKALQKTIESRRIDDGMRHQLRAMKRKKAVQP